jgi:ribosomal protein S18 acetylase RimI-like enzyme
MNAPLDPEVRVRSAKASDLPAVVDHWLAITRHHAPLDPLFTLRPGARAEVRGIAGAILRDPDSAVFVAEGRAGVCGLVIVRIDRAPPILEETRRAEITDLGVSPDVRRRGVGRALAAAALAWARERGVARAEVRVVVGNQEGRAFWTGLGFAPLLETLQLSLGGEP